MAAGMHLSSLDGYVYHSTSTLSMICHCRQHCTVLPFHHLLMVQYV